MAEPTAWRPIVAALAHETARRVFAELVLTGRATDALERLSPSRARHVVTLLRTARMIDVAEDGSVTMNGDVYRDILRESAPPARPTGVERFLTAEGRIASYPANPTERGQLLARIAESAVRDDEVLSEPDLNDRLSGYTADVAVLRRYLVDYGELERTRSGSEYARPVRPLQT